MNAGVFNLVLLVAFIALIYFMMIRPEKKREKQMNDMRSALKAGDEIVTVGGIVGRIVRVKEDLLLIETGSGKAKIEILKTAVGSGKKSKNVKEEPVAEKEDEEEPAKKEVKKIKPKKLGGHKTHEESESEADN